MCHCARKELANNKVDPLVSCHSERVLQPLVYDLARAVADGVHARQTQPQSGKEAIKLGAIHDGKGNGGGDGCVDQISINTYKNILSKLPSQHYAVLSRLSANIRHSSIFTILRGFLVRSCIS